MFEYWLWFLSLTTWPCCDPLCNPLFQTSGKPVSLQRSSFILDLYAPLSLDDTTVLDLLPNSQTTPGTSRILGVPRRHLKYSDKSMRWAQCTSWSQCLNPSWFQLNSAVHHSTSWQFGTMFMRIIDKACASISSHLASLSTSVSVGCHAVPNM